VTLEPTEALIVERAAFAQACQARPGVGHLLTAMLAARVRRLEEQLARSLLAPVEDRITGRLADLADLWCAAAAENGGIPLTQQDLATLAGTSRATVNRVLTHLVEDGAIEVRRGRIRVLDRCRILAHRR
jgi:CRP-like cAMP-binding protein